METRNMGIWGQLLSLCCPRTVALFCPSTGKKRGLDRRPEGRRLHTPLPLSQVANYAKQKAQPETAVGVV